MLELIVQKLVEEAAKSAVSMLTDALKRENSKLLKDDVRLDAKFAHTAHITKDAATQHIEEIKTWCASVNFTDMESRKSTQQIYVEVDTYLVPMSRHESPAERARTRPLLKALTEEVGHTAILGTAGAGKTTSLKKICVDYFHKGKVLLNYSFPILIHLRDLRSANTTTPITQKLQEILAFQVAFPSSQDASIAQLKSAISQRVTAAYVDKLKIVILLDGYDEISSDRDRRAILQDFDTLSKTLVKSRLILTSRSSDFRHSGESIRKFEIAPLTMDQIEIFARRWLMAEEKALEFIKKVAASPFADTAIRPLTMAHLCAIYERTSDIPDKPKSVYKRIINMLLKEWDEDRKVERKSKYAKFEVDQKAEFLAQLAFELTTREGAIRFDTSMLERLYALIRKDHGLPENEAKNVIQEIESHNGLVIKSGYDDFEFAHKSLQEYLAADYIVRLPALVSISSKLHRLPNELAIATSLSSRPGEYFCELMLRALSNLKLKASWYDTFAIRLIQEKPDLTIGHTVYTTIAALHLVTRTEDRRRIGSILRQMTPHGTIRSLSRYYRVSERDNGLIKFSRLPTEPEKKLPSELIATEDMLN